MTDTPETDAMEYIDSMCDEEKFVVSEFARKLERERDLWKTEAELWRDMYMEYDEMLEGQVREAVERLNQIWVDLDQLKQKVQDDLLND